MPPTRNSDGRDRGDRPVRQLGDDPAERHGDQGLHGEGQADADPDQQRAVAGRQDEGGDERLVRQLDRHDRG